MRKMERWERERGREGDGVSAQFRRGGAAACREEETTTRNEAKAGETRKMASRYSVRETGQTRQAWSTQHSTCEESKNKSCISLRLPTAANAPPHIVSAASLTLVRGTKQRLTRTYTEKNKEYMGRTQASFHAPPPAPLSRPSPSRSSRQP